jgi:hypothetical protein
MIEEDPQEGRKLRVAATATNAVEADLICQRLAEAGISAISQRSIGGPEWGVSGGQYVYVEAAHLDRARDVLKASGDLSDEELAELSEQGFQETTEPNQQTRPPGEDEQREPGG